MDSVVERLGGRAGVSTAAYALYERLVDDEATRSYFEDVDLPAIRAHMTDFLIAALTGRPDTYRGRPLDAAHRGLGITDTAFDAVVVHLVDVLSDLDVSENDAASIVARLAPLRPVVVD